MRPITFFHHNSSIVADPDECLKRLSNESDESIDNYNNRSFVSDNSFKHYYFYYLLNNFGNNDVGSCGYVAMAMLLTYFDTYWDDNIVPSSYEVPGYMSSLDVSTCNSSPGTTRESTCPEMYRPITYVVGEGENQQTFTDYSPYKTWLYNNYYYSSLHAKLIVDYIGTSSPDGPFVGPSTFYNVFSMYFNSINYSSYAYIRSPVGATSAEVKAWVINQIVNYNRPVILGTSGHVTVAYYYDSDTDTVYVHNGWLSHSCDPFTTSFDDAHTIRLTGSHNHSNNYVYSNSGFCECGLSSHEHFFNYISLSSTQHSVNCHCGYYDVEDHSFILISPLPFGIMECEKCKIRQFF